MIDGLAGLAEELVNCVAFRLTLFVLLLSRRLFNERGDVSHVDELAHEVVVHDFEDVDHDDFLLLPAHLVLVRVAHLEVQIAPLLDSLLQGRQLNVVVILR